MAGNYRFHDKLHKKNHHSAPTVGYPDSAVDPIASRDEPFQGDFVVNGLLSSSLGIDLLSANIRQDLKTNELYVYGTTHVNQISGMSNETIISDAFQSGNGANTLTLAYQTGIYINSPNTYVINTLNSNGVLNANNTLNANKNIVLRNTQINFVGSVLDVTQNSSENNIAKFSSDVNSNIFEINKNGINLNYGNLYVKNNVNVDGNLLIKGNLSALGDISVIETNVAATSSLSVNNTGANTAMIVNQVGSYPTAIFRNNGSDILNINQNGLTVYGTLTASSSINSPNINLLQSTSSNWNNVYNVNTTNSSNWISVYNSVLNTSGNWNNVYNLNVTNSSSWISVYNSVLAASGSWNSVYNTNLTNSASWVDTKNVVTSNSANWLSGSSNIDFQCKSIKIVNTMHLPLSVVTLNAIASSYLVLTTPSYLFVTLTVDGTADIILPSTTSNNIGITFYIKNLSTANNRILRIRDSSGVTITQGSSLNGNANAFTQVIWDGTKWQTIIAG